MSVRFPRIATVLASAALLIGAGACAAQLSDEPVRNGSQQEYVGADKSLTLVPVADRRSAPAISGMVLGRDVDISTADFAGKVVVLNVWGASCPPCRAEMPDLQRASDRTQKIAQFVGLNTRDYQQAAPIKFAKEAGVTYPSIWDPDGTVLVSLAGTLPPKAIPSTLLIDRKGRVAGRIVGRVSEETLVTMINDIAEGR